MPAWNRNKKRSAHRAEVFAIKAANSAPFAKRMRETVEGAEESIVEVRREDKTIRDFTIPVQELTRSSTASVVTIKSVSGVKT